MPKVSIIIPVFNAEKFLHKSMDSIINQTLDDIEIICINDGSTDNSLKILQDYQNKDDRIVIINKENAGQGIARNIGLEIAKGKYITFVDSDDWIDNHLCEEVYNKAIETDCDVIIFDYLKINGRNLQKNKIIRFSDSLRKNKISISKNNIYNYEDIKSIVLDKMSNTPWGKLYKNTFIKKHNFKFGKGFIGEDKIFQIAVKLSAKSIYYYSKPLYYYNINEESSSFTRAVDSIEILQEIKELLVFHNKYKELKSQYLQMTIRLLCKELKNKSYRERVVVYEKLSSLLDDEDYIETKRKVVKKCKFKIEKWKNIFSKEEHCKNKFKISIFAFIEDRNIGDPVIGETCKYLVENICNENKINAKIDLYPIFPPKCMKKFWISKFIRKRCRLNQSNKNRFLTYLIFRIYVALNYKYRRYYKKCLKNTDFVIFGGGGMLKYISQDFWASNYCIIDYCDKHNIPVYFNAIGIEGYDSSNFTCKLQETLVKKKCVVGITTRDDIDALNNILPNQQNVVVGDPALYSKDFYENKIEKENLVGINTIRSGIFNVNGFDITEQELIDFYCEMIKRLDKDCIKWQLFTNGLKCDYELALKILDKLNIVQDENVLASLPRTTQELANLISKYKGVIAGRMHAHIIATSYDIPTVGQIWNEKIKWFAYHMGAQERFFYPSEMKDYDNIYEKLIFAMKEGNNKLNIKYLKEQTYLTLEKIIKKVSKGFRQSGKI